MPGITNPNEKYFKDGLWTFNGSVWRPQTQMFGVRDAVAEAINVASAPTNPYTLSFTAVPTDELHVVTFVSASNWTDASFSAIVIASINGVTLNLKRADGITTGLQLEFSGWVVLTPGDRMQIFFANGAVGDNLKGWLAGFKMMIAE
jgi:hypothetical protein